MNVLAVDAGTTAVKAAAADQTGDITRVSRVMVDRGPGPGIDPEQYWKAVAQAISEVADTAAPVDAVTVTGQGDGLWTLDGNGAPTGDALEWNSTVAGEIVAQWEADGTIADHYARTATVLWPGTTAALWNWAQQHQPRLVADTRRVLYAKDWINYRLCGTIATDITDATIPFLDIFAGRYDPQAFSSLGCDDLAGAMAPIVGAGTEIGAITAHAAAATGLAAGTPVLMGTIDVVAMTRGVGGERARPGRGRAGHHRGRYGHRRPARHRWRTGGGHAADRPRRAAVSAGDGSVVGHQHARLVPSRVLPFGVIAPRGFLGRLRRRRTRRGHAPLSGRGAGPVPSPAGHRGLLRNHRPHQPRRSRPGRRPGYHVLAAPLRGARGVNHARHGGAHRRRHHQHHMVPTRRRRHGLPR